MHVQTSLAKLVSGLQTAWPPHQHCDMKVSPSWPGWDLAGLSPGKHIW